jgi:hypothetical protein
MNINLIAVENALAEGHVWIRVSARRYWRCRRNGKTQTWKTRPTHFRIPIKAGFKHCTEITQDTALGVGNPQDRPDFLVSSHDPNLSLLTERQEEKAKALLGLRPTVLPGTRVILDQEQAKWWFSKVTEEMNGLRLNEGQIQAFCDLAGVPD